MVLASRDNKFGQSFLQETPGHEEVAEHLSIAVARDLLDWLEVHGIQPRNVGIDPEGRMTVCWIS